jgi:Tfp pilus assembly protein PilF
MAREARIQEIMAETGMDEMQAYRHVQQRDRIHNQLRHDPAFMRKHIKQMRALIASQSGRADTDSRSWGNRI